MIRCCNCVQGMNELDEASVDLTITSPPYDDLRAYQGYDFDHEAVLTALYRVIKPGGVVVWIVADATDNGSETGTSFRQALYAKEIGFNLHDTMIYLRNAVTNPSHVRYYNCFQYMFIFSKGKPKTVHLIKDHKNKTAGKKHTGKYQREADGEWNVRASFKQAKVRPEYSARWNIWSYDVGSLIMAEDREWVGHPAVFPLRLAEDHIKTWSEPGEVVLDPMCGSGQTCIAAKRLGRQYLGMDICQEYCDLATKRLALYQAI
jgi:DNA modification methylase